MCCAAQHYSVQVPEHHSSSLYHAIHLQVQYTFRTPWLLSKSGLCPGAKARSLGANETEV